MSRGTGNLTDGICFLAVFAFDNDYKYAVRAGSVTVGTPNILIPEPAVLSTLSILLLVFWPRRRNGRALGLNRPDILQPRLLAVRQGVYDMGSSFDGKAETSTREKRKGGD